MLSTYTEMVIYNWPYIRLTCNIIFKFIGVVPYSILINLILVEINSIFIVDYRMISFNNKDTII